MLGLLVVMVVVVVVVVAEVEVWRSDVLERHVVLYCVNDLENSIQVNLVFVILIAIVSDVFAAVRCLLVSEENDDHYYYRYSEHEPSDFPDDLCRFLLYERMSHFDDMDLGDRQCLWLVLVNVSHDHG